tara:strand:- start:593 stop:853 length:261 start_codon:yes stop_codon:yes gene_type:complete
MTSKEFKIWLEGFLLGLDLDNIEVRDGIGGSYNNLTMLKTINNKLKQVKDQNESNTNITNLITERLIPITPPNPFTIICGDKKEEK